MEPVRFCVDERLFVPSTSGSGIEGLRVNAIAIFLGCIGARFFGS